MKYFFAFLSLLLFQTIQSQSWIWTGVPQAGADAQLTIMDAPPTDEKKILTMYYLDGGKLYAQGIDLRKGETAGSCVANVSIPQNASWVSFALKDHEGELLSQFDDEIKNGNSKPKAASIENGLGLSLYARNLGMDKNDAVANTLFRDGIITDSKWLDEPDVLRGYYQVAKALNSSTDLDMVKNHITSLSKKPGNASEALLVQSTRLAQALGDTTLKETLRKQTDKLYPKNLLVQEEAMLAFKKATPVEEKVKLYTQYKTKFPVTDDNRMNFTNMAISIVQEYAAKEDWQMVRKYIFEIPTPMNKANVANQYAWQLSGESTETEGAFYEIAADLSSTSLKLLESDIPKPTHLTETEWKNNLSFSEAQFSDTYALILYKLGKYEEAAKYQLVALKGYDYGDAEMNERYAIYLDKAKRQDDLLPFMDQMLLSGKASAKMKEMHHRYWTKTATQEQLYAQYLSQLEDRAHERLENKIRKMWIETEPAQFTLKDLNGKDVSLNDYKGKTVVLDFWATWCGPCKASFPGMKKAVEHYASDKDVVFLFVDTWEQKDNNMDSKVSSFIRDNNYPFHVLMDRDDKVVKDFNIQGIPTKYIIGPDQKVRFISVGYNGSTDELLEEMKIMIEMARGGNPVRS